MRNWLVPVLGAAVIFAFVSGEEDDEELDEDDPDFDPDFDEDTSVPKLKPEQYDAMFAKMVGNTSGKVALKDLMAFSALTREQIARQSSPGIAAHMDSDKDGKLSLKEYTKDLNAMDKTEQVQKRLDIETAMFREADANQDGLLDKDEFPGLFYNEIHPGILKVAATATLNDKDGDSDGKLTIFEFWKGPYPGDEDVLNEVEEGEFRMVDKDEDGFVGLQELMYWESGVIHIEEAMKSFLDAADIDNDTHVSREELSQRYDEVRGTDSYYHFADWARHHEL